MPLAVWPCAQHTDAGQTGSAAAEISRRAIKAYTEPGGLVLDPLCDDPHATTLVEAIRLGRDALGVTGLDPERTTDALLALQDARRDGASGEARLLVGVADKPGELLRLLARQGRPLLERRGYGEAVRDLARHPCGAIDLVLLAATIEAIEPQRRPRRWRTRPSGDDLLSACVALLRPGGFLVLAATATAAADLVVADPAGELVQLWQSHGLQYWQHVIALQVPIRDDRLQPESTSSRCHTDLLVFRKPSGAGDERQGRSR